MKDCSQIRTPKEELKFEVLPEGIAAIELLKTMGFNTSKIESHMNRVLSEIESNSRTVPEDEGVHNAFLELVENNPDTLNRVNEFANQLEAKMNTLCSFNPETCQMDWDSYRQICREAARYHLEGRLQEYLASDRPKTICKKSFPWIAVAGLGALGFGVWLATKK